MRIRKLAVGVALAAGMLGPLAVPALAPSLSATAYATDPNTWQPGDLILFPGGSTGHVDEGGRTITPDDGRIGGRWNSAVRIEDAAALGARKIN